jgi:hypothetical protein
MTDCRAHALLSASGSHKWLNCTPSARLEESLPETESDYANEGRLAHEIGELKLRKTFIEPIGPRAFNSKLKKLQEKPLYQDEMLKCTDIYLEYVSGIVHSFAYPPYIAVEKRIDYSIYAQEGFGTGDCIIIGGNTLHVIDYKHGKGVPVSAYRNPQMLLYALGAYTEYSFLYPIETVKVTIIQPRLDDGISKFSLPIEELLSWGEMITPIAKAAYEGVGEYVPGEYCRFCRAKARCRARCDTHTALEDFHMMKPPLISNEEVGLILTRAQNLAKWVSDLEEYTLGECLLGNYVPGWKVVEGRSVRQFTDPDAAFNILKANGTEEVMLYERKPLSLANIEKLIGKPKFKELLSLLVETPPGKPALAPASDTRNAIKRRSAEDDFKNNEGSSGNE